MLAVVLLLCVVVLDDLTGHDVSFTLLYLGPIGVATWFSGLRAGLALSLLSAAASTFCDAGAHATPLPVGIEAWNLSVQAGVFVSVSLLLRALRERLDAEQLLARTDPLTHVANRRAFVETAAIELERSRRGGVPFTVAYVDCDDFKQVNDELGHAEGDALLATVARTLRAETRSFEAVARLGGDEFGLLLVEADGSTAEAALHRVRAALLASMRERGWKVTFSIGAVTFLDAPYSVEEMIGRADQVMYEMKRDGKDGLKHEVFGRRPQLVRSLASA